MLTQLRNLPWLWIVAGLIAAAAVHAATILAIPILTQRDAWTALAATSAPNRFFVLDRTGIQPLSGLAPDVIYGVCRYDLTAGNVQLRLPLDEPNWSVALSNRRAANYYSTTGAELKRRSVKMLVVPRNRLAAEASSENSAEGDEQIIVIAPETEGVLLLRAPVRGESFVPGILAALAGAKCEPFVEPPPDVVAQEVAPAPAEVPARRSRRR